MKQAVCFVLFNIPFVAVGQPMDDVEIEFEPMGPGDGPPPPLVDLLNGLAGPGSMPRSPPQAGKKQREAQLDDMLADMFGMPRGKHPPGLLQSKAGGGRGDDIFQMIPDDVDGPILIESGPVIEGGPLPMVNGPLGGPMGNVFGGPPGPRGSPSKIPGGLIRDLFPGAMLMEAPLEHPQPFQDPDPVIMDMMRSIDRGFKDDVLPTAIAAASSDRLPNSCNNDIQKLCSGAKSHLHCLGQHADSVSDKCRADVGKSVPFKCSKAIDKYCDVLQTGILYCLDQHLGAGHLGELDPDCQDAVATTKHVINIVNSQKAAVRDPVTGTKKVSVPATASPAASFVSVSSRSDEWIDGTTRNVILLLLALMGVLIWTTYLFNNGDVAIKVRRALLPGSLDGTQALLKKNSELKGSHLELPKPVDC